MTSVGGGLLTARLDCSSLRIWENGSSVTKILLYNYETPSRVYIVHLTEGSSRLAAYSGCCCQQINSSSTGWVCADCGKKIKKVGFVHAASSIVFTSYQEIERFISDWTGWGVDNIKVEIGEESA